MSKSTSKLHPKRRELARRGRDRMDEARATVTARALTRGEDGLVVTRVMVRQEMARRVIELMHGKVLYTISDVL